MNQTGLRLVAVGDSLTEGVGDPHWGGLHGWIHYLTSDSAAGIPLILVANLARSGATVADLRRRQLHRAVALAPDIITCAIGVNDVIGRRFDAATFEQDYEHVIGALAGAATRGVLTMTLHDVAAGLPLPRDTRVALRCRIAQANTVIERVSEEYGGWVIDARAATSMNGLGMLSLDRLHPNRRGHRYIAAFTLDVLRAHGAVAQDGSAAVIPAADPLVRRLRAEAAHLLWLGRHMAVPTIKALTRSMRSAPGIR